MDYSALAQLLNQDAQKQAQQNPWMISANNISQADTGNNFGATALKGLLSGISASLGERSVERDTNARNESLRGFMSAAPEAQQGLLQSDKYLKPYSGVLGAIQADEQRQLAAQQAKEDRGAMADMSKTLIGESAKKMGPAQLQGLLSSEQPIVKTANGGYKISSVAKPGDPNAPASDVADLTEEDKFQRLQKLQASFNSSKEYVNHANVVEQSAIIKQLAKANDPASNMMLTYSFIKLADANAVKEGEIDMVALAQGPAARLAGQIEYVLKSGGVMGKELKDQMVKIADKKDKNLKRAIGGWRIHTKSRVGDRVFRLSF